MGWHISIHTFVGTLIPVNITYGPISVGGVSDLKHLNPIAIDKDHPPPEGHADRRENPFEMHPLHIDLKKQLDEARERLHRNRPKPEDHPQPKDDNSDDNSNNDSTDDEWQWDATDEHFKDYASLGARGGGGGGGG